MKALHMPELTEEQQTKLVAVYRTTKDVRIRTRAQMVLLACEQHLSAPSIAVIVREDAPDGTALAQTLSPGGKRRLG